MSVLTACACACCHPLLARLTQVVKELHCLGVDLDLATFDDTTAVQCRAYQEASASVFQAAAFLDTVGDELGAALVERQGVVGGGVGKGRPVRARKKRPRRKTRVGQESR